MNLVTELTTNWLQLYPGGTTELLEQFLPEIEKARKSISEEPHQPGWYKDVVVYSLYVDLFNENFKGLIDKLDYLQELGVNCLWLLPILDSPMKDAGFDIRNYYRIRPELLESNEDGILKEQHRLFSDFLSKAHERGLKVIFDIAINHTSDEHPWFVESRKSENNPYRNYYIWSKDTGLYKEARIIFEGLCESNWEKNGKWYYFHRFFEFQPDLNYKNPKVLVEMTRVFLYWLVEGVDGFRADAIPYLWKEEGTSCENLSKNHTVLKFIRAVLDYVRPNTLLLAEACQKPEEVVKYFGEDDECNAGYHFPLMPQIFKSIASNDKKPIENVLAADVTPVIPETAQWFTFLRCHDELSLELVYVTEEDRKYIHENYCHQPLWDFRRGQGVAARLADLLNLDHRKTGLAFSIMLSLPGTPIIYYGDEFGKLNDKENYEEQKKLTGKDDTRFLVRGKMDWVAIENNLSDSNSFSSRVFEKIKSLLMARNNFKSFGRGNIKWISVYDHDGVTANNVLSFIRSFGKEKVLILNNLSGAEIKIKSEFIMNSIQTDLLNQKLKYTSEANQIILEPYQYCWIDLS